MPESSCFSFLQLLCGCPRRRGGSAKTPDDMKVKIRVGFDGKDTLIDPATLNVKSTFGCFAVLLEYSNNKIIPLNKDGFAGEPLDTRKRYVVVLNTHGSSQKKWDVHRGGKHKKKHSTNKKSKKSKPKKEKKELASGGELKTFPSNSSVDFSGKDFAAASTQALLAPNPTPDNGDDSLF